MKASSSSLLLLFLPFILSLFPIPHLSLLLSLFLLLLSLYFLSLNSPSPLPPPPPTPTPPPSSYAPRAANWPAQSSVISEAAAGAECASVESERGSIHKNTFLFVLPTTNHEKAKRPN